MRGAERVVDVDVGELGELRGELGVVLRLTLLVADVLEHEDVAGREVVGERSHVVADDRRRERHVGPGELGESIRRRAQRQLRLAILRATEVGDEDQASTALAEFLDRRQRGADAGVVGDRAVIERDVEVDADEDPLTAQVPEIAQRPHAIFWTRSTSRFE